jgi:hypothetical protein
MAELHRPARKSHQTRPIAPVQKHREPKRQHSPTAQDQTRQPVARPRRATDQHCPHHEPDHEPDQEHTPEPAYEPEAPAAGSGRTMPAS